jgi:tRNA pseudouridine38-40 synthase
MRTFKLILEYDGSDFSGWQVQLNARRTVQGEIEAVLLKIFKKHTVLVGSGRTDRGVHAKGQVAHFRADTDMPCAEIQRALNCNLPADVVVLNVQKVHADFHAQMDARWKRYSYTILNRPYRCALERRVSCYFSGKLDLVLMRQEAKALIGRRDFKAFANVDPSRTCDAIRTIRSLDITKRGAWIVIRIEANGFLYKMVRNIAGTLLQVGAGRFPSGSVRKMLRSRDRRNAGVAAPPQGLCLEKVFY